MHGYAEHKVYIDYLLKIFSLTLDSDQSDSQCGKQQDLEAILGKSYELDQSESDQSGSENSENGVEEESEIEQQEEFDEVEAQDGEEQGELEEWDENEIGESGSKVDESDVEVEGWEKNGNEEEGECSESKQMQKLSQSDSDEIMKGKAVVHQIGE